MALKEGFKGLLERRISLAFLISAFFLMLFAFSISSTIVEGSNSTGNSSVGDGPLIFLIDPLNNTIDLDGNVTFSYNVTSNETTIANCSLIFNGTMNQTDHNITPLTTQYFTLNDIPDANYNWNVNCTNQFGNVTSISETRDIEVFIDASPPIVTLNGPANGSTTSDGNFTINYTVTDDGWVTSCGLYTNISGTWQENQTNIFVQENVSLYFEVESVPDDTSFEWNVLCYDFASTPNSKWGNFNRTLRIDNTAPSSSAIQNQSWQEDNYTTLNLSDYFSDIDGDVLNYTWESSDNITVTTDNETGIITIKSDINWYGSRSIIFYASDHMGENISSNNITLTVSEAGDTPPNAIYTSPVDNYNDTDGFVTFACNSTDDHSLNNIDFYTNVGGTWELNQTTNVTGATNSSVFNLTYLNEGSYLWGCKFTDNSSQSSWSQNKTFNVDITAEINHNLHNFTINHVDHNKTIIISYSNYLNNSLSLGNLTIYLSNGSIYHTKNMSNVQKVEVNLTSPPLNLHAEKIRIKYDEIFYNNFTIGNQEWLNISLKYYHLNKTYHISTKHTIEVKSPWST